jgi:hypothetical protein
VLLGLGFKESRRTSRIRSYDGKDVLVLVTVQCLETFGGPVLFLLTAASAQSEKGARSAPNEEKSAAYTQYPKFEEPLSSKYSTPWVTSLFECERTRIRLVSPSRAFRQRAIPRRPRSAGVIPCGTTLEPFTLNVESRIQ